MYVAKGFWWTGRPNFGDLLTPLLLRRFTNIRPILTPKEEADLVVVGSILEMLDPQWGGVIAGSGKMFEKTNISFPNASILGLRGPLTAKGIKIDFALGDPGLLADELVSVEKQYNLGIVPHWSDTELEHRFGQYNPIIIRSSDDPIKVISEIGQCRKIVSSSLHGIIVADAFGIPRRIEMASQFAKEGGDFKFRDHNAAIGLKMAVGLTQEAPRHNVQARQHELYDMFIELGNYFDA